MYTKKIARRKAATDSPDGACFDTWIKENTCVFGTTKYACHEAWFNLFVPRHGMLFLLLRVIHC